MNYNNYKVLYIKIIYLLKYILFIKINGIIPAPLEWNKERTMPLDIQLLETKMYLIKDHIQLITDLITDWTDGAPIENEYFVPTIYDINITFKEFSILLCVNECNIIDQLNDKDQNCKNMDIVLYCLLNYFKYLYY